MQLWIDAVRPAPAGYVWCISVNHAISKIQSAEWLYLYKYNGNNGSNANIISVIDIDHDAGDFVCDGGDYIKILDWLEKTGRDYPIRIHSHDSVAVANMRRIIERNGWKEVF